MGEIKLSDGKKITIDVSKITLGEWRGLFSGKGTLEQDDEILSKVSGIPVDEIESLFYQDYRRIVQAMLKAGNEPLSDPNSQSAST